jgi:hypothetical protein
MRYSEAPDSGEKGEYFSRVIAFADQFVLSESLNQETLAEFHRQSSQNDFEFSRSAVALGYALTKKHRWDEICLSFKYALPLLPEEEVRDLYTNWIFIAELLLRKPELEPVLRSRIVQEGVAVAKQYIALEPRKAFSYLNALGICSHSVQPEVFKLSFEYLQKLNSFTKKRSVPSYENVVQSLLPSWTMMAERIAEVEQTGKLVCISVGPAGLVPKDDLIVRPLE